MPNPASNPLPKSHHSKTGQLQSHSISASWLRGIKELLLAQGLDARALFAEAALDFDALGNPDARFDVQSVDSLWALAAVRSSQPYIALRRSQMDQAASFDVLAYAMMSCRDLGESIARMIGYVRVVSDSVQLQTSVVNGGLRISVLPLEPPQPGRDARLDYTIVTFLAFCRWVSGRRIVPLTVDLPYAAPVERLLHEQAFDCHPNFDAAHHALVLRDADLHAPLPTSNPALSAMHERIVQERVRQMSTSGITAQVAASIMKHITQGRITRQMIAADLCMSDRTLQRRLVEAGTSFKDELDALRRQLTETYLKSDRVPLSSLPYLLGFADEGTVFRACKRWFQMSPGQLRASDVAESTAHSALVNPDACS